MTWALSLTRSWENLACILAISKGNHGGSMSPVSRSSKGLVSSQYPVPGAGVSAVGPTAEQMLLHHMGAMAGGGVVYQVTSRPCAPVLADML